MEYLDIYDENGNHLGIKNRKIVHQKGLWHKTIHCWLYDSEGNVYFQIRKDENKLYTTASGHVLAGEIIKDAFNREINEELGIDTSVLNKEQIQTVHFRMDKIGKDEMFIDRAFANIFICKISLNLNELNFDSKEVEGLAKVNAKKFLNCLDWKKAT